MSRDIRGAAKRVIEAEDRAKSGTAGDVVEAEVIEEEPVVEEEVHVKRKTRGGKIFSLQDNVKAGDEAINETIKHTVYWMRIGMAHKCKTDDEIAERIADYFQWLADTPGTLPVWEQLCIAIGYDRGVINRWENGQNCSTERSDIIKFAKENILAMTSEMAMRRQISEIVYFFRSKNYHGLRDQVEYIPAKIDPAAGLEDPEAVRRRYLLQVGMGDATPTKAGLESALASAQQALDDGIDVNVDV